MIVSIGRRLVVVFYIINAVFDSYFRYSFYKELCLQNKSITYAWTFHYDFLFNFYSSQDIL